MCNIQAILEMHRTNVASVHVPGEAIDDIAIFVAEENRDSVTYHLTRKVVSIAVQHRKIKKHATRPGQLARRSIENRHVARQVAQQNDRVSRNNR